MNISLATSGKKKKGTLGYGLNDRKDNSKKSSSNVFGDDDDDDHDHDDNGFPSSSGDNRKAVNEQIAMEQAALRRRAQAALTSVEDPSVYDYDGAYDSFKNDNTNDTEQKSNNDDSTRERKSKYIGDLLKAAKVRERERDAIYERRIAREQAEEDAKEEYAGKEKFVTKAYKRKLEERKRWEQEEEQKEREEAANDVTKKSAGAAFASFYGNLNKNVSVGGAAKESDGVAAVEPPTGTLEALDDFDPRQGFLGGFERSTAEDENELQETMKNANADKSETGTSSFQDPAGVAVQRPKEPQLSMRERRDKKVAEARIRYLQRKEAMLADQ
jgi:coiled-coil domain-containing protein 55